MSAAPLKRLAALLAELASTGFTKEKTTMTTPKNGKVYLVSRSEYEVPLGHRVTIYHDTDLLSWFQEQWAGGELEKVVAGKVPVAAGGHAGSSAFSEVFYEMQEKKAPRNWSELNKMLSQCSTDGVIQVSEHAIQGVTDDDEIDKAWYLFDEEFVKANPGRVSYLLQEDWRMEEKAGDSGVPLPAVKTKVGNPGQDGGEGRVHCVFLSSLDGMTIMDHTGNLRFDGMRLPEFRDYLCAHEVAIVKGTFGEEESEWPEELLLLRAAFLRSEARSFEQALKELGPAKVNEWLPHARPLSDLACRLKQPGLLAGDRESCDRDWKQLEAMVAIKDPASYWQTELLPPLIQTSPHFCQIRFRDKLTGKPADPEQHFARAWFFFDDLWMTAHPELAESLLHYGKGWDVLFDEKSE